MNQNSALPRHAWEASPLGLRVAVGTLVGDIRARHGLALIRQWCDEFGITPPCYRIELLEHDVCCVRKS